jgi:adenylate kinase family enzyme
MVEEFGYTHISTGDLMRLEMQTVRKIIKLIVNSNLFTLF